MTNDNKKTSGAKAHYVTNRPVGSVVSQIKTIVDNLGLTTIEVINHQELEAAQKRIEQLQLELKFTQEYLNPADTSFRQMIDAFKVLPKEKQNQLIDLSRSLLALSQEPGERG